MKFINTRIYLNGSNVGVHEATWSASITNDLPGRFTSGDAVPQRTGKIRWRNAENILTEISPLDTGYPKPGDTIRIVAEVTENGTKTETPVFTGRVDVTSGGMGIPLVSDIIDNSDDLNTSVSWYPLIQRMPRRQNTVWASPYTGLTGGYMMEEVARQCGFGPQYPGFRGDWALMAPLSGATWTDFIRGEGALNASGLSQTTTGSPRWAFINGQRGMYEGYASWDNDARKSVGTHGFFIDFDILGMTTTTYCRVGVRFGSDSFVYLTIESGALWVHHGSGNSTRVQYLAAGNHTVGLYYPHNVGGAIWVRVDQATVTTSLTRTESSHDMIGANPQQARTVFNAPMFVDKSGAGLVSYVAIGRMTSTQRGAGNWQTLMRARTGSRVYVDTDPEAAWLEYIPGIQSETGKNALEQITKPLCISTWLDGNDVLHFESGQQMRLNPSILTLTESMYEPLEWDSNYTHAASRVTTKGKVPEIEMRNSGRCTVEVWTGSSSDTFIDGYRNTIMVNIPDNEDYFELDTHPVNLTAAYYEVRLDDGPAYEAERAKDYWRGAQSVFSIARTNQNQSAENFDDRVNPWDIFCTVERISVKTYKVYIGFNSEDAWIATTAPQLPERVAEKMNIKNYSVGMPILRAGAGVTLRDAAAVSTVTGGPKGPELIHDMGPYTYLADRMRQVLSEYFATAHPVFNDITTLFDPRIEVGVCLTIDASTTWGYSFKVLVTQIDHDPAAGTTKFTPRVIEATKTRRTYAEVARDFADYKAVEAVGTYSNL